MNKTIFLGSNKIDDKSFYIDVLYFSATSYSKSLYPTLSRYFKEYANVHFKGGNYTSKEHNITETGKMDDVITSNIYFIKRVIYTKK